MDATTEAQIDTLHKSAKTGEALLLPLETDDRVLARVTDGIYRQPSSAIRELIANAYDADATEVTVVTDAPRYSSIIVRDNGNGMSAEVLLNMVQHIGGSAKRTQTGQKIGVTDPTDAALSPGKRKLIGKMGIGLFSVSQLTRQFTIITKPKDEKYRYTAVVTLHRYTDEDLGSSTTTGKFRSGETKIISEVAQKTEPSGTTIELGDLIPRARRVLQSTEMWSALREPTATAGAVRRVPPIVHSGLAGQSGDDFVVQPKVPWERRTSAAKRLDYLSTALLRGAKENELYAQIDNAFDYYFKMIWSLSLALPLPYIGDNPFGLPDKTKAKTFLLSNRSRSASTASADNQASDLKTDEKTSVSSATGIEPPRAGSDFKVDMDGIRLLRPIRFDQIPSGTSRALQTNLLFVGSFNPDLSKFDKTQRGGQDLEFSGYFFWSPRILPKEHNGLLIRINGASGTLFDSTFLNYQIAERTRLKQITAEIFVSKGLEEALNIDREAFNTSHPHYQILLNWVHNALRQIFNKQKELESTLRSKRTTQAGAKSRTAVQKTRDEELTRVLGDDDDTLRDVVFTDDTTESTNARDSGSRVFPLTDVVIEPVAERVGRVSEKVTQRILLNQERASALVQLLDAYELLDNLSSEQQQQLVKGILRIFNSGD